MLSRRHCGRQRGTSMIEVLVTLIIVAIGFLGLLGLQSRSISWQRDAFERKAAAEMVEQLAERIRANHLGFARSDYRFALPAGEPPPPIGGCSLAGACTSREIAQRDAALWLRDLRRRIPSAAASASPGSGLMLDVTLAWQEPAATGASSAACGALRVPATGWQCYTATVFP